MLKKKYPALSEQLVDEILSDPRIRKALDERRKPEIDHSKPFPKSRHGLGTDFLRLLQKQVEQPIDGEMLTDLQAAERFQVLQSRVQSIAQKFGGVVGSGILTLSDVDRAAIEAEMQAVLDEIRQMQLDVKSMRLAKEWSHKENSKPVGQRHGLMTWEMQERLKRRKERG